MAKTASTLELSPDSEVTQRPSRPRTRRSRIPANATDVVAAGNPALRSLSKKKSVTKPVLVGLGLGAAFAVAGMVVRANLQPAPKQQGARSTLAGALGKAALFAIGRIVVERAARSLAEKAAVLLADRAAGRFARAWIDKPAA